MFYKAVSNKIITGLCIDMQYLNYAIIILCRKDSYEFIKFNLNRSYSGSCISAIAADLLSRTAYGRLLVRLAPGILHNYPQMTF